MAEQVSMGNSTKALFSVMLSTIIMRRLIAFIIATTFGVTPCMWHKICRVEGGSGEIHAPEGDDNCLGERAIDRRDGHVSSGEAVYRH